ncbi:MAG: MFS transporter, partial [Deltaproteobacteria bacterium]|nr:MFS transporter [Deltaproteobacteria bacterium]
MTTEIAPPPRTQLPAMGLAYALGAFNDNFFKQAALLLAASAGLHSLQGIATLLFALPFVLFSAWAGWLADHLPKRSIVLGSKVLELAAMLLGLLALFALHWSGMVAVVCLMGLQSTLFSPALNGSIPESFAASAVPRVNALFKLITTAAILLGMVLGGVILDLPQPGAVFFPTPEGMYGFGRFAVGLCAVFTSLIGLAAARAMRKSAPPSGAGNPFPLFGPFDSLRHALHCRAADRPLFLVLAGEAFFYSLSTFVLLCINNLGVNRLGFSL